MASSSGATRSPKNRSEQILYSRLSRLSCGATSATLPQEKLRSKIPVRPLVCIVRNAAKQPYIRLRARREICEIFPFRKMHHSFSVNCGERPNGALGGVESSDPPQKTSTARVPEYGSFTVLLCIEYSRKSFVAQSYDSERFCSAFASLTQKAKEASVNLMSVAFVTRRGKGWPSSG